MTVRSTYTLVLVLALSSSFTLGCSVFNKKLVPPDKGNQDAGCGAVPPLPPQTTDGTSVPTVILALRDPLLPTGSATAGQVGYNLDGFCTAQAGDPSECIPQAYGLDGGVLMDQPTPADLPNGVDNSFGQSFYKLVDLGLRFILNPVYNIYPKELDSMGNLVPMPFNDVARAYQDAGFGTFVVEIQDWNGTANDPAITVSILQAAGGTPCADVPNVTFEPIDGSTTSGRLVMKSDPTLLAPPPKWDGGDCWFIRGDSYPNNDPTNTPNLQDQGAYVANGILVTRIAAGVPLLFFAGPVGATVKLGGGMSTAHVVLSDGGVSSDDVRVVGRWKHGDVQATGDSVGVCVNSQLYSTLDGQAQQDLDVMATPPQTIPTATGQHCDAMSLGVRFQSAVQGKLVTDATGKQIVGPNCPMPDPCCDPSNPPPGGCPATCGTLPDKDLNPYRGDGGVPDAGTPSDGGMDAG